MQYHNVDVQGPVDISSVPCEIFTAKSVQALEGDRIWLISGEGRPRVYKLMGSFLAADIQQARSETEKNKVRGTTERWFRLGIRIDTQPWFEELKRATGNFAFGLQRIKEVDITRSLVDLSSDHPGDMSEATPDHTVGGSFGTPEENRLVEKAAIDAVTARYVADGWVVVSHEDRKYGYDLHCSKSQMICHVEVKGLQGSACSFILTANEKEFSQGRSSFRLCVVTNALDPENREIQTFTADELSSKFDLEPVAYYARPKK